MSQKPLITLFAFFSTIACLCLSGCVTSRSIYTGSGQHGYEITCSGYKNTWEDCLAKAGDLCKSKGYSVLEKNNERIPFGFNSVNATSDMKAKLFSYNEHNTFDSIGVAGFKVHRSMLVVCGGNP